MSGTRTVNMLLATESKENMKNNQDHAKRTQVVVPTGQRWDNLSHQKRTMTPVN